MRFSSLPPLVGASLVLIISIPAGLGAGGCAAGPESSALDHGDPDAGPTAVGDAGTRADVGVGSRGDAGSESNGDHGAGSAGSACDPACATGTVCVDGACEASLSGVAPLDAVLLGDPTPFDERVLISQQPDLSWRPSTIYRWRDFVQAVASMHQTGVGDFTLWLGDEADSDDARTRYGLVNLAAFLAQSMKETIKYDACDENNWDSTNGYAISNACGQLGQDYGNYDCEMACPRSPTLATSAVTHASWYGAPGPLFCAPDATLVAAGLAQPDGRTGHWDYSHDCWPYPATEPNFSPADEEAYSRPECEVYEGQKAGRWVWDGSGDSVEGCCWWGRGVIQTTGRCNFGILNHNLGRTHLDTSVHPQPSTVLYPNIDFCEDPEVICRSTEHPELKWIAGLFYWMSSVQTYDRDGWSYTERLRAYVDGGMTSDAFIDSVSGIVNRGCHSPPCSTGAVDGAAERRDNFDLVLQVMGLKE